MQDQTEATPWHIVKNQITGLRVFESRIEDLRSLLAEDFQTRLCRRELHPVAAASHRSSPDAVRLDHPDNPAFSAC
jgi:hypothetical protein